MNVANVTPKKRAFAISIPVSTLSLPPERQTENFKNLGGLQPQELPRHELIGFLWLLLDHLKRSF